MKKIIAGNWKMNQDVKTIRDFFTSLSSHKNEIHSEAWIACQFIHIPLVQELSKTTMGSKVKVGAQNCANKEKGAFTGEVSPIALKDMGVDFVLIGHSERRTIYKETDALLNEKLHLALNSGLTAVFCIGETLQEREANQTFDVVRRQVLDGMKGITADKLPKLVVAYEPVWAIGTGKTATPEQAQEVQAFVRGLHVELFGTNGKSIPILYGGSVTPSNVAELLAKPDIDGGLVGGASLKSDDYLKLCLAGN